ncbi:MAG: peptidyl-prolyl cis-trans isomerase [Candidatus Omnitrophica bacterium]|nr:peptidyl-prolyl cis-trans isomerase [Candidatus Omnitrophota bacterium]
MSKKISIVLICLICFAVIGCGKKGVGKGKVVATIDGEPIYVSDVNNALELNVKRDPMFRVTPETLDTQLAILIDRRLLIKEAKKRELDQKETFIKTIQTFWEQTLIRDLMAAEDRKLNESVAVSTEEVRDYYDKLSHERTFGIIKSRNREVVDEAMKKNPDEVIWDEEIGPLSYEDVNSAVLFMAFDIPKGQARVIMDRDLYYLIYVKDVVDAEVPSFDEAKEKIEERIRNLGKQRAFNSWVGAVRADADVKINSDVLHTLEYSRE